MEAKKLKDILAKHKLWLDEKPGGQRANLQEANLQGADLDFSCWPLWCGSKGVKVDIKLVWQLLAHVACLKCGNPEYEKIKKAILPYARKSHRADDLGITRPRREEGAKDA